ncbi:MAG: chemotaxis protein CheW [Pseudomonadota bacterium]
MGQRRIGVDIEYLAEVGIIQKLLPLVSERPEVDGAISLRNSIVPLLSIPRLCNFDAPANTEPPKLAAVLQHEGRLVALAIDAASEILEYKQAEIQAFYEDDRKATSIVRSGLESEAGNVNLVEVPAIFELADLPFCHRPPSAHRGTVDGSKAFLMFEAGGAHFGLEAVRIFGTVPRRQIDVGPLTNGACLGSIDHLSRRLPVVSATDVFGLGNSLESQSPEIVTVNYPDGKLLGFAVDRIQRIRFVRSSDLLSVPDLFDTKDTLFSAVVSEESTQVFILNADALMEKEELLRLSSLSNDAEDVTDATEDLASDGDTKINRTRQRCLVFSAGAQLAAPITQVISILEQPTTLTPVGTGNPSLLGFFKHLDQPVPLVCLMAELGISGVEEEYDARRVLLVGPKERRVGFLVNTVDSVETAEYSAEDPQSGSFYDEIVKLRGDAFRAFLPFLNLEDMAARVVITAR